MEIVGCIANCLMLSVFLLLASASRLVEAEGSIALQIAVSDDEGQPLPCRIHLADQQGEAQKVAGLPFWRDHFVCSGRVAASLKPGRYEYVIERGPEYRRASGTVTVVAGEESTLRVKLERHSNLRAAGWYSGDLHVHRSLEEIELLMQAEDLDFAPVITWWNQRDLWQENEIPKQVVRQFDGHRISSVMAGEDEREGGALLYFGLRTPLDIRSIDRESPSPMQFVRAARRRDSRVWIDIEKPFWWDVPVWLASGQMDSIGIANNHMCRSQMYPDEAWGKPRDVKRLPKPYGNGYWSQEIYYHMLNCGLRVPPSAGSASGVLPNPVGYNRVYVHLDQPFSRDAWFEGLARGTSFLTNGPLLLVTVDGTDPGSIIQLKVDESRTLQLKIRLTTQDPVSELELIQNGNVVKKISCSGVLTQDHSLQFSVDEPGWFLVRAITNVENTFRFATTAPWFVEVENRKHRISRRSVGFFADWVDERIERVKASVENESQLEQVLVWHEQAQKFWAERLRMSNAE